MYNTVVLIFHSAKYSPIPAHGLIVRTPTCIYSCGTVALMHTLIRKLHVWFCSFSKTIRATVPQLIKRVIEYIVAREIVNLKAKPRMVMCFKGYNIFVTLSNTPLYIILCNWYMMIMKERVLWNEYWTSSS
jgi:hypothetical protein